METTKINRYNQAPLRTGKHLRNRVVIPPMASEKADLNGFVTASTLEHYARLAEAKPGLLIVEYTFVHTSGRSEENQLGIDQDGQIEGLRQLANLIKCSGATAGIQIVHGGGKSSKALTGDRLMGPSGIRVPVKGEVLEEPTAMSLDDIELWKIAFAQAVDRAVQAGFDLVEFHAAHGYGLNQWLSPITNQRQDQYGQNIEGRSRLLLQIVRATRQKYPNLLLSVRMPGQDFLEDGLSPEDTIQIAKALEAADVDFLHISSGIGGWRRPATRIGEGYLVWEATQIQAQVKTPVIGVGGIESGAYIDAGLQQGWFGLAAVGRAILKDPGAWKAANLSDRI